MNRRKDSTNPTTLRVLIVEVAAEALNSIEVKTEGLRKTTDIKLMIGTGDARLEAIENLEKLSEIGETRIREETDMRDGTDGMNGTKNLDLES